MRWGVVSVCGSAVRQWAAADAMMSLADDHGRGPGAEWDAANLMNYKPAEPAAQTKVHIVSQCSVLAAACGPVSALATEAGGHGEA